MQYVRRASPLHAARAPVAAGYAAALVTAVLAFENPIALAALAFAIVGAATFAGAGRILLRAALFGVPFALLIALVNPLVADQGLTVLARLGEVGPLGNVDVTLEGLTFGAILGLRALLIVLASSALLTATVDSDELLRGFRRISVRSALTAALAVRLVPVLGRDARRLADARRCRPDASARPGPAERLQIVRAVATGALDRALDVAATLEVRGYATPVPSRAPRSRVGRLRAPWSRHDLAFAASAVGLVLLAAGARLLGVARFEAYPRTVVAAGPAEWLLAVAIVLVALLPFADRRGVAR
ncbi:MAG TPA: energy-coupling factor transporter transmembrane component T [Solirubrobacteraceae bacterium]|jgi:energy-coupling factor transport system permease protein|nr:energy-coupling factor transporter transmembrane component T [Solirubrobacteraceae bacterium]